MEHFRRNCAELTIALNVGITCYNDKSYLVDDTFDEELSLMFEKGGMKKVIGMKSSPIAVSARNVMIDELYDHLGGDSILRTTLDFDEGTYIEEIVDVNAAKKRKLGQTS